MKKTDRNFQKNLSKEKLEQLNELIEQPETGEERKQWIDKLRKISRELQANWKKILFQIKRGERDEKDRALGKSLLEAEDVINDLLDYLASEYKWEKNIRNLVKDEIIPYLEKIKSLSAKGRVEKKKAEESIEAIGVEELKRLEQIAREQNWDKEKWSKLYRIAENPQIVDSLYEAVDGEKYENLGSYLKELRNKKGVSLRKVEESTGIDHTYLHQLEAEKKDSPSQEVLDQLCTYYKANPLILYPLAGRWPKRTPDFVLTKGKRKEETLGEYLKKRRQARALSQTQLAELAGISRTALSDVETGSAKPRPRTLYRMARAMELTDKEAEYLFGLSDYSFDQNTWQKELDKKLTTTSLKKEEEKETLGQYLKRKRESRGLSQYELSNKTSISKTHLSNLENKKIKPRRSTLYKLARAIDFTEKEAEKLFGLAGYSFKPEDLTKPLDREFKFGKLTDERLNFGETLKKARKEVGMTQQQLAEYLDRTQAVVGKIETGERGPSDEVLEKLGEIFPSYEIRFYQASGRLPDRVLQRLSKELLRG